jgi:hypothetical protein
VTTVAIVLAAVLAAICVLVVARPFIRDPEPAADTLAEPTGPEWERARLAEDRDRALAALKELEFDHRTGKVSDADYRAALGSLRAEAAAALRALDEQEGRRAPVVSREETRA